MAQLRTRSSAKKENLLHAAERLMLERGYWGTSVEDVCKAAAVTKGAFFHYFADKEQLGLAALDQFVATMVGRLKEAVESVRSLDALGRICAYCDLIAHVAQIQNPHGGCLIATFVMENRSADSVFAKRCSMYLASWIELLRQQFVAALSKKQWASAAAPAELAQLCICVIEGALILARGKRDPTIVTSALEHFKRYVSWLVHGNDRQPPVPECCPAAAVRDMPASAPQAGSAAAARCAPDVEPHTPIASTAAVPGSERQRVRAAAEDAKRRRRKKPATP